MEDNKKKEIKKKKMSAKSKQNKDKYFAYYDDIKDGTHKVVDW